MAFWSGLSPPWHACVEAVSIHKARAAAAPVTACDAAASADSCSKLVARLGLCGFLRDGVDSAGFCDLYYGLKEDYSGGDAAGERWRSEHAK